MGLFALFLGLFGALCGIVSILTATQAIPPLGTDFTSMYWMTMSGVLFLSSIALLLSRSRGQ